MSEERAEYTVDEPVNCKLKCRYCLKPLRVFRRDGLPMMFACDTCKREGYVFDQQPIPIPKPEPEPWICPRCKRVWGPQVRGCDSCNLHFRLDKIE